MYPTVEGTYQLFFTFAWVHLLIELWQVEGRTLRYEGKLTDGGLRLELKERRDARRPEAGCVRLALQAPDRWWP
jgi:hypothetical protein